MAAGITICPLLLTTVVIGKTLSYHGVKFKVLSTGTVACLFGGADSGKALPDIQPLQAKLHLPVS